MHFMFTSVAGFFFVCANITKSLIPVLQYFPFAQAIINNEFTTLSIAIT